jgi:mycobactin phenyloxazoline synthetase
VVEGSRQGDVLAALVGVDGADLTEAQIRDALAELVPPHMIPRHLGLVEAIPFTVGGKTDRRAAASALATLAGTAGAQRRAPETELERALVAILAELLGASEIGTEDDFFEMGGDSVLATAAVSRVRQWLDTPTVGVPDIFATRTVRALARRLRERENGSERLELVAQLYLEVAQMDNDDVAAALESAHAS